MASYWSHCLSVATEAFILSYHEATDLVSFAIPRCQRVECMNHWHATYLRARRLATGSYSTHYQLIIRTLEPYTINRQSHTFSSNLENNCIRNFKNHTIGFASYNFKIASATISQIGLECVWLPILIMQMVAIWLAIIVSSSSFFWLSILAVNDRLNYLAWHLKPSFTLELLLIGAYSTSLYIGDNHDDCDF